MPKSGENSWGQCGYTCVSSWRASNIIKGIGSTISLFTNYASSLYLLENLNNLYSKVLGMVIKYMHYVFNCGVILWGNFGYTHVSSWRASNIVKGFGSTISLLTNYGSSLNLLSNGSKFDNFLRKFIYLLIKFI